MLFDQQTIFPASIFRRTERGEIKNHEGIPSPFFSLIYRDYAQNMIV